MQPFSDFIRTAAPLVVMGLLLAIFAVRLTVGKKKGKNSENGYGTEGMCLGMCIHKGSGDGDK